MTQRKVKVIADGVTVEEAEEIILKAIGGHNNHDSGCKFEDPLVETILDKMDEIYLGLIIDAVKNVVGEIKTDASL